MGDTRIPISKVEYRPGLYLHVIAPRATILAFHGGSFAYGSPGVFMPMFEAFASSRIQGVAATYRTHRTHQTTVYEAIDDALEATKAAIKGWPRTPLFLLGISAGGLLAFLSAMKLRKHIKGVALINPVLDLSAEGFHSEATPAGGDKRISPAHLPIKEFPRTLIMHGTRDATCPIDTSRTMAAKLSCKLIEFPGQGHGWFARTPENREEVVKLICDFVLEATAS